MPTMTPPSPSDTELLRQLRSGSAETAADVVQEVFMGLLTGSFKFDPLRGLLQNFLFGVARNLVMRHDPPRLRFAALPEPDHDDGDPCADGDNASDAAEPLAHLLHNEQAEQVRRALALLPPYYRDVVILYEMHDLSYLEIADVCQLDIGTVRSRLSRGRAALAKRLGALRPATL